MPELPVFVHDIEYTGKSYTEEVTSIHTEPGEKDAENIVLLALNEIAWTLNPHGNDVHCNPVVIGYLLITEDGMILLITLEKVAEEIRSYLEEQ